MSLDVITKLVEIQAAVGEALNNEQQLFVSAEYPKFAVYLHTDAGKTAMQTFVDAWRVAAHTATQTAHVQPVADDPYDVRRFT